MPKEAKRLSQKQIDSDPRSVFAVGGVQGLMVKKNAKTLQYFLRWRNKPEEGEKQGKLQTFFYPVGITLKEAREIAAEDVKRMRLKGISPVQKQLQDLERLEQEKRLIQEKEREKANTFGKVALEWITVAEKNGAFKNNHVGGKKARGLLNNHLLADLGEIPIKEVTCEMLAEVIGKSYKQSRSTGNKVNTAARKVFEFADLQGYIEFDKSPINRRLVLLLREAKKNAPDERAQPALPPKELPDFIAELSLLTKQSAKCLLFSILTAARSQVARGVRWNYVDLNEGIYAVPAELDKDSSQPRIGRLYLSKPAIEILMRQKQFQEELGIYKDDGLVFPSEGKYHFGKHKPLTAESLGKVIAELHAKRISERGKGWVDPESRDEDNNPRPIVQHGTARATFGTWANSDLTESGKPYDYNPIQLCLLHTKKVLGSDYRFAYLRGLISTFEKAQRAIMEDWGRFCMSKVENH